MSTNMPIDAVFYHPGGRIQDADIAFLNDEEPEGWYFWTETWADFFGPYPSEETAKSELRLYGESL